MTEQFKLLVEGGPSAAGRNTVTAPYDGDALAEIESAGGGHVDAALSTAYRLFRDRGAWLPVHERVAILERAAETMSSCKEALALGAAAEGGKPLIDSRIEVERAIDGVKLCVEHLRTDHGSVIPMGGTSASRHRVAFTRKEPIGVVVAVSAFNHPLNLIVHQVVAAVAAGCPVIVKPAGDTPLSCFRFVSILHEAGLPPEWCQAFVTEDLDVAERLVTDSRVGFFSFIGSAKIGWMLRSKLAPGTRCALEHGGAAPVIVAADADIDRAIPAITKGGYYHAGQVCVSVQRLFVQRSVYGEVAERLAEAANNLVIGDPLSEDTDVGPLIRHREVDRVHAWVEEAMSAGAERLIGGDRLSPSTYPCTVLLEPPADVRVSTQEIFGPVVCLYPYDNVATAVAQANDLPYAFQAAVFTQSLDEALTAFERLDALAVMINDHSAFRIDGMPFAGLKQSGLGIGGIPYTMNDMRIDKMAVVYSPGLL